MWYLKGQKGDNTHHFEVLLDREMILGRDRYSPVPLVTKYASRRHATITKGKKAGVWFIEDMGSQNGIVLNDVKLETNVKHVLRENDEIMIGCSTDLPESMKFKVLKTTPEIVERIRLKDISNGVNNGPDNTVFDKEDDEKLTKKVCFVKIVSLDWSSVEHLIPGHLKLTSSERTSRLQVDNKETKDRKRTASSSSDVQILGPDMPSKRPRMESPRPSTSRMRDDSPEVNSKKPVKKSSGSESPVKSSPLRRSPRKTSSSFQKDHRRENEYQNKRSDSPEVKKSERKINKPGVTDDKLDALNCLKNERIKRTIPLLCIPAQPLSRLGQEKPTASGRTQRPSATVTSTAQASQYKNSTGSTASRLDPRLKPRMATPPPTNHDFDPFRDIPATGPEVVIGKQRVSHLSNRPNVPAVRPPPSNSLMMKPGSSTQLNQLQPGPSNSLVSRVQVPAKPIPVKKPKMNIDEYLERILKWNPQWLLERKLHKEEPPVVSELERRPLKDTYDNHEEYLATQYPFILYEIFANFAEAFSYVTDSSFMECHIMNTDNSSLYFTRVNVEFAVPPTKTKIRHPQDGDAVVLELRLKEVIPQPNGEHTLMDFMGFGYISEYNIEHSASFAHKHYSVPPGCTKVVKCVINIKKHTSFTIETRRPAKVVRLDYIRPSLKHIEALLALKNSKLLTDIIRPRIVTCQIPFPREGDTSSDKYNEGQHQAIIGSAEAVNRGPFMPKIVLIQGPPGTGKTHTLIGIVQQIFKAWTNPHLSLPKILVCAPSNGAVDEIGSRLYAVRQFLKNIFPKDHHNRSLRCVRIGQDDQVRSDCIHMTIDFLVNDNLKNSGGALENQARKVEKQMGDLDLKISNLRNRNRDKEAEEAEKEMEILSKEAHRLRTTQQKGGDMEFRKRHLRDEILRKADVILTTLNSCRSSLLETLFSTTAENGGFSCVIVDEASQCSEPEVLMPLYYQSISKMILIGDPMQLPATVKSVTASNTGYGRSFFERVFRYFGGYCDENPVHMLNQQFRMHKEICDFPSREFYGGRLKSAAGAGYLANFPLKPYTVIDVTNTRQDTSDPKNIVNKGEAAFVCSVLKLMEQHLSPQSTVGVITPYKGQKKLLQEKIQALSLSNIKVDVNTIDGFQGQERQVIIFSSVRASEEGSDSSSIGFMGSVQRMNVALTRAKHGLVVCISRPALESNKLWGSLISDAETRGCLKQLPATASHDSITKVLFNVKNGKKEA